MFAFDHPELEEQLKRCPEPLQLLAFRFAGWCARMGMSRPRITCIFRTPEHNKAVGGHPKSYHLTCRAIDFGTGQMASWEKPLAEKWWREHIDSRFDLVTKLHGTGPHIHVEQERD